MKNTLLSPTNYGWKTDGWDGHKSHVWHWIYTCAWVGVSLVVGRSMISCPVIDFNGDPLPASPPSALALGSTERVRTELLLVYSLYSCCAINSQHLWHQGCRQGVTYGPAARDAGEKNTPHQLFYWRTALLWRKCCVFTPFFQIILFVRSRFCVKSTAYLTRYPDVHLSRNVLQWHRPLQVDTTVIELSVSCHVFITHFWVNILSKKVIKKKGFDSIY